MNIKYLCYCVLLFAIGQVSVWFQSNGQFISEWFKNNSFILSLFGIPISYVYINATKYGGLAFGGNLWPQRFIGFSVGIMAFAILTNNFLGEGINLKTGLSLFLSFIIILIQIFIK
jgi:hypothetical protein